MAQANVAREPSMEEILASIRKIIESNDVTEDHEPVSESAADDDDHGPSTEPPQRPVSLLNRIPGEGAEVSAPKARESSAKHTRIEPMAPLRPGLEPRGETAPGSEEADTAQTKPSDAKRAAPARLADIAAAARPAPSRIPQPSGNPEPPEMKEPSEKPEATASGQNDVVFLPDADQDIDANGNKGADDALERGAKEETVSEQRALISPAVGARVAASFDDLSHAVTKGPSRSFDDIAEEMLRPMLQQWMDDNLPTLVERLVREEIERVARGR